MEWVFQMLPENYNGATLGLAEDSYLTLSPTADEIGKWDPTVNCHMSTQCL